MYGPSGKKAYTESVLEILRQNGLIKNSPPKYFRRYHKTGDNTKYSADTEYFCPTQDTDWMNDRDIRYKQKANRTYKTSQYHNIQYTVPTSNRFASLNQGNY